MPQRLFARKNYVYAVYQERSFSKAAQKLFVSQPSLSAMIRQLEEELGVPLFDRSCKPIAMTEAGMAYVRAVEKIQSIEQNYYNYICAVNNLEAGSLAIGSNQLFSSLVLPRYVSEFVSRCPKIQLKLVDANSAELEQKLIDGQLDLIIDNKELDSAKFDRLDFCTENLLLAVPKAFGVNDNAGQFRLSLRDVLDNRHRTENVPPVPLRLFDGVPMILMTRDNDTRLRTDIIFRESGFSPRILLEIDRLVTLYNFVSRGTAAAVVSDTLIQNMGHPSDEVLFYRLNSPAAHRGVYIHSKKNKLHLPAMLCFEALLCPEAPPPEQ